MLGAGDQVHFLREREAAEERVGLQRGPRQRRSVVRAMKTRKSARCGELKAVPGGPHVDPRRCQVKDATGRENPQRQPRPQQAIRRPFPSSDRSFLSALRLARAKGKSQKRVVVRNRTAHNADSMTLRALCLRCLPVLFLNASRGLVFRLRRGVTCLEAEPCKGGGSTLSGALSPTPEGTPGRARMLLRRHGGHRRSHLCATRNARSAGICNGNGTRRPG